MTLLLPSVLDASVALVAEGYQSWGADWWTALERARRAGEEKPPEMPAEMQPAREKTEAEKVAENNAALAALMGGAGALFKGAK